MVVGANGNVSFTPGASYNALAVGETAQVQFSYTISDGNGGTSSAIGTITITGANDGPVAVNDTATVSENSTVAFNILTNDSDADASDVLTVTGYEAPAGLDGNLVVGANGNVSFTPGAS